nr:toprim domain-containing protein [Haliscomenobacter sp.]
MRYKGYHHVQEALQFLEAIFKAGMAPSAAQEEKSPQGALFDSVAQVENPVLELKRVTPLKMSLPYIAQRGIDEAVAKLYLKEVHFINTNTGKNYFAAGIKNVSGGYEIRNPYFKSSIGKKDLSFVPGEEGRGVVSVFEGIMDFLTYLTEEKRLRMPEDVIILNSISFLQRAKSYLQARRYTRILTFFDNDRTGELATEDFLSSFPSGVVIPQNQRYSGFVDYNGKIDLS